MKKNLLIAFLFVIAMSFTGCKEDVVYALNNTKWVNNDTEDNRVNTIQFEETTFLEYSTWMENEIPQLYENNGYYTYNKPIVKIKIDEKTKSGIIDENKLTIEGVIFTKQ